MLALGVMTFLTSFAQTRQLSGKVTDTKGAAIANASVIVKGSKVGVNTSEEKLLKLNMAMIDDVAKTISEFMKEYKAMEEKPKVLFISKAEVYGSHIEKLMDGIIYQAIHP